ncbi:MAG: ABC transporter permease subunit [Actinomycetia bacterium]|nr:ABC transporter permease subunit [Actinomycetes bacterium]
MITSIFTKSLWDRRRSTGWWALGMVALAGVTVAVFPSIRNDTESFQNLFDSMPEGLMTMFGADDSATLFTATGLINSRIYAGIGPAILAVFGIGLGTAAVAGEEERGTLDLLLAQPVARTRLILEKFAAIVVATVVICASIGLTLSVLNPLVDLELEAVNLVAANLGLGLLTLVFSSLALAIGAVTGNRGLTIGVSATTTVFAFFVNGLAPLVDSLSWTQKLSPFFWLQGPNRLANGFSPGYSLLMVGVIVILLATSIWGFNRRDVGV